MARSVPVHRIRNIGIIAHVDAGKTTLTERILFYTGKLHVMGEVHEGSTRTDYTPQEQQKGITITAAAVSCDWRGHRIQLIDTPGHVDFTVEVERTLRVLDGAVVVLDAVAGVESQTETVWRQADRHAIPRLCFVNKLDRAGADFERCVEMIATRLHARPVVLTLPIGAESGFIGLVDLIRMNALVWRSPGDGTRWDVEPIPPVLRATAEAWRGRLIDACGDVDDAFAARFVETGDVGEADLVFALRKGTLSGALVPTLAGSAYRNRGVQRLLDAVVDLLPAPDDRPPVRSIDGSASRAASDDAPLAALCFKLIHDDFGPLAFVRVYAGVLRKGMVVLSSRTGQRVRVTRLVRLFADVRDEVAELAAGEIGAAVGMSLRTGETVSDPGAPIVLEAIRVPPSVVRLAIEPRTRVDHDRMGPALAKLLVEDPSLELTQDPETGQTLLAGMGVLHLEIAVDRLRTDHHVEVTAGRPEVAYRETIRHSVVHEVKHVKQTGGPGQYAHLRIELTPGAPGSGLRFEDRLRGGAIPKSFVPAIEKGIGDGTDTGPLGGYPVVDVSVALLDGSFHADDSSDMAFRIAAARAFREAAALASPVLLEPVMQAEVVAPAGRIGEVIGDLGARRGRVTALEERGDDRVVRVRVPLAEMFGYAGALQSVTRGHGAFTMELVGHEPVPDAPARPALARR